MESNAVQAVRSLLEDRLKELDQERARIEGALSNLNGGPQRRGRPPGRPAGSAGPGHPPKATPKRKRRRGKGTRADQAAAIVESTPGITASEIAKQLKIQPNYLYRVLGELEGGGRVRKEGRSYHPVPTA